MSAALEKRLFCVSCLVYAFIYTRRHRLREWSSILRIGTALGFARHVFCLPRDFGFIKSRPEYIWNKKSIGKLELSNYHEPVLRASLILQLPEEANLSTFQAVTEIIQARMFGIQISNVLSLIGLRNYKTRNLEIHKKQTIGLNSYIGVKKMMR